MPLRVAAVGVLAAGVIGAVSPGTLGRTAAYVLIGILIAVPVLRIGFLGARWWQIGDRRFSWWAFGLLAIIAAGAVAALGA